MHEKLIAVCAAAGALGSYIVSLLGGWDNAIVTLIIFMSADFIMGLVCAAFFGKSNKSENGALSSKACRQGIIKKFGTLLIVVCASRADVLLGTNYLRNAIVIAFCTAELISIMETAGLMGILPPAVNNILTKIIDLLKSKGGAGNE